ncbi:annexin A3a [Neolamprologus brichardi]|uniref:annexin A3a n=1 Tax=Neolamprologus brichardi TaxID=32507 RepID=UPI001643D87E|nr:annexin A3a [Neolamprologus brichardi]
MGSLLDDLESLVDAPSSFSAKGGERGTIKPKANFDAEQDAAALKKAIDGFGTNEKIVIEILTTRSSAQRQLICKAYEKATSRCVLLQGAGTKDKVLIEIFASRSNQQIKALSDVYFKETKKQLTAALEREVSGDYSKALLLLALGKRDESTTVDVNKAREDAKTLYNAGEKKWGTDESKFIEILCKKSIPHLRQTVIEYKNISGKTLQQSIEGEMSGDLENLLVAVVKCVKSVPGYFAELLHESMKGAGTDESTLTRIMVSRSEIDLLDIRAEFKKLYGHSLLSAIKSDLSGDQCECVKAICGGDD